MAPLHDVIVIGLGGMGSAAAHHLSARGARVLGLERHGPVHDRGSSHGGSRLTRQAYFEDPAYVPLLLRAYELYGELERDTGRDIATLCGGIMIGRPESRAVSGSLRSARKWELPHETLDAAEVRRRFPTLTPREDEVALYEARAGFLRPENTVAAQLQLALRGGADLHFEEPVIRWEELPGGTGVRVHTTQDTYTAGRLVICPGAWAPGLLDDLGVPFTVERQLMHWFRPSGGTGPYDPATHPVYLWEDTEGVQMYGFPALDGPSGGAKVAFFRRGTVCTPDTLDRTVHPDEVADMAEHLAARIPTLPGEHLKSVACMYTTSPDQNFVLGPHPEYPGTTVVACGFSGHGFKFAPVVGEIAADLALTGSTGHPIGLFDPRRPSATLPASSSASPSAHLLHGARP
ncbi:N-methyl-L-tryptophan oxidase [Streptomyces sp. ODS28]|uniref:N-methyl-L-tryptophan oxidase n=1 Tax=Streptomyces sp. ODS28 TaxID=3136688 RepID=UPI0031E57E61